MAEENIPEPLLFKDFRIDQLIFEARYIWGKNSFDNLRPFFMNVQDSLPDTLRPVEQGETFVFHYKNSFEISIAPDRFSIVELNPNPNIQEFLKITEILYDASVKFSEIENLTRVGLRVIYAKNYAEPRMVADALYKSEYINFPENLYLADKGKPMLPSCTIGWQDEEKGISYRLRGKTEKLGVNLPLRLLAEKGLPPTVEKAYNQVILDIDVFIHKSTLPGQFFITEWIAQANKTAKNEVKKFFGE